MTPLDLPPRRVRSLNVDGISAARGTERRVLVLSIAILVAGAQANVEDPPATSVDPFAGIIENAQKALVVIRSSDRRGEERGLGSGFVVRADGIVATNFHVIGRGRSFTVQLHDGREARPTEILAYDRHQDVALVRVDQNELHALPLAAKREVRVGEPVVCVGHPLGLRSSVSKGVVAATRDVDERSLIQVAMPIEEGNSGGPLIDRDGDVIGVVTLKSTIAASLGFAVPIREVRRLLDRPRPVPIARWQTIGALSSRRWLTRFGGAWRQRAGKLVASGQGGGFGGRMLCLSRKAPAEGRLEIAVEVKLEDERGAAGLVFHSDGGDRHYGFYPTSGSLRLTSFEGADVYSWRILETVRSDAYRIGEWNEIRVVVEGKRIECFCNGESVIRADDEARASGSIGLVKFRRPGAEFRRFRAGESLAPFRVDSDVAHKIVALTDKLSDRAAPDSSVVGELADLGDVASRSIDVRADELERKIQRLRHIARRVHHATIERALAEAVAGENRDLDLLRVALLIARGDNRDLDVESYVEWVDVAAEEVESRFGDDDAEPRRLEILTSYLFDELGFHGSHSQYYHRSNSYMNEVIDDREGLPIMLSVLLMECAKRVGLRVDGLGIPFHFIVRFVPKDGEPVLLDPFDGGRVITRADATELSGNALREEHLEPAAPRDIALRILRNLIGVAERESDVYAMLRYLDYVLVLAPESAIDRWARAVLRFRTARPAGAREDLEWLLEHPSADVDRANVEDLLRRL